ncbi:MAG: rod shape-determining protein MreD [Deltaproteobacteria bacterium]|nr:rod shape-determining protein MreD [Deltaproteobacteria bacterium]MBW2071741.1 rod shape-determining protein MreD [Deltaproteobacteria bacterium]
MRRFLLYTCMLFVAYILQSAVFAEILPAAFCPDLFLVLVVHANLTHGEETGLLISIVAGLLVDTGLPPGTGFFTIFYPVVALFVFFFRQSLNLQSRRYQAAFLGCCSLAQTAAMLAVMKLQTPELFASAYLLHVGLGRTLVILFLGPLLLYCLDELEVWSERFGKHGEFHEV